VNIANVKMPVPADAIEALARSLYPAIRSYYESEEGQAAFAEWKSRKDAAEQPAATEEYLPNAG
jgi:hypothetical protein